MSLRLGKYPPQTLAHVSQLPICVSCQVQHLLKQNLKVDKAFLIKQQLVRLVNQLGVYTRGVGISMCTHPRGCFLYEEHCSLTSHRWTSNLPVSCMWGLPGGSVVKNLPANAAGKGSIPGSGSSPREGNGNPCQYSCLGNPMDRGAWQVTVYGVVKESDTTQRLNHSNNHIFFVHSSFDK